MVSGMIELGGRASPTDPRLQPVGNAHPTRTPGSG